MHYPIALFSLPLIASSSLFKIPSNKEIASEHLAANDKTELQIISNKFKDEAKPKHAAEEGVLPTQELRTCLGARAMKDLIDGQPAKFCLHIYRAKGWSKEN